MFAKDPPFCSVARTHRGLKLGCTFAWRSLMAAELIRQDVFGVGRMLETGRNFNDVSLMMASKLRSWPSASWSTELSLAQSSRRFVVATGWKSKPSRSARSSILLTMR